MSFQLVIAEKPSVDVYKRQKQARCPNGLKLGTPGSGKSMSCKSEIVSVFLTTADDIFISDPEAEYYPLVKRLHGQVIKPVSYTHLDVYKRQTPYCL